MKRHFPARLPLILAMILVIGLLVMLLWNAVLPSLLGLPTVGYFQALGLLILCRLLFGGLGPGRPHWGRGLRDHWRRMSPEDREAFMSRGRGHFHHHRERGRPDVNNSQSSAPTGPEE